MSSWARVGVKCVFVGDAGMPHEPGSDYIENPTVGEIYTINWTGMLDHQFCIGFAELHQNGAWDVRCFRPLQTISQADDVAMFRKLVETMKPTERLDIIAEKLGFDYKRKTDTLNTTPS